MKSLGNADRRPLIAVSTWQRHVDVEPYGLLSLHATGSDYVRAVQSAGARAVLVPRDAPGTAGEALTGCDALVLIGGDDVDPESYGQRNTGASQRTSRDADAFDIALVAAARDFGIPVLAICRGMQVLNVACGGTLIQHLADGPVVHQAVAGSAATADPAHAVTVTGAGVLHDVYGARLIVNSLHHQAIERCAAGLTVVAHAPDGVVEAVESSDPEWPAVGVQWHPEKTGSGAGIFEWLVEQAARTGARRRPHGYRKVDCDI